MHRKPVKRNSCLRVCVLCSWRAPACDGGGGEGGGGRRANQMDASSLLPPSRLPLPLLRLLCEGRVPALRAQDLSDVWCVTDVSPAGGAARGLKKTKCGGWEGKYSEIFFLIYIYLFSLCLFPLMLRENLKISPPASAAALAGRGEAVPPAGGSCVCQGPPRHRRHPAGLNYSGPWH